MAEVGNSTMQQDAHETEDPHAHERALIAKFNCYSTMLAATPVKASAISRFARSSNRASKRRRPATDSGVMASSQRRSA